MNYLQLLKLALPEVVVVSTALVVLAIGLGSPKSRVICSVLALIGLLIAMGAVLTLPARASLFDGMLVISPLNSIFLIIGMALALATILIAPVRASSRDHAEYLAIILLATIGLMLLVTSEEFLMIFIGLELLGLSLYVLTAFERSDVRSAEAALKYFLFGSTASAFTLFGISLVYGLRGSTSLAAIGEWTGTPSISPLLAAGIVMTLIGFAFKIAAAPFHLWAPDAYQGAPAPSAAFIASGSKVASFFVLGKIVLLGFGALAGSASWHSFVAGWSPILAVLAALSILLGNFVALVQSNVRRLLAYSAVAHAGYTLLGLIADTPEGFAATLFYVTIYGVTLVGAFAVCGAVRDLTGGDDLENFVGLSKRSPFLAICLSIFLLSLAGIPPLAGFFGKFYLFSVAYHTGPNHGLLWLVVVALFGSFVSLYYYLIVLKAALVDAAATEVKPGRFGFGSAVTLILSAGAVVLIGCVPMPLLHQILAAL